MPVVIEQPSPMSPDIMGNAGRADAMQRGTGTLAGMYETQMNNQARAAEAAAQISFQASAETQRNLRTGADRQFGEEMDWRKLQESRQVSPRDEFMASQDIKSQNHRAELGAWLQNQEMSQAETIRLQRMEAAVGAVNADPNMTDDERVDLITQLRTGIDPMRQRLEATQMKLKNSQSQKIMEEAARQEVFRNEGDTIWAKYAKNGIATIPDMEGNQRQYVRKANGDWQEIGQKQKGEVPDKSAGLSVEQWSNHYEKTGRMVDRQIADEKKAFEERKAAAEKEGEAPPIGESGTPRTARIADLMERAGFGRTLADRPGAKQPTPPPFGSQDNPPPGPPLGPPPGGMSPQVDSNPPLPTGPPPRAPSAGAPFPETAKPMSLDDSRLTPQQKMALAPFQSMRNSVLFADMPEAKIAGLVAAVDEQQMLIQKNGSLAAMSDRELARYRELGIKFASQRLPTAEAKKAREDAERAADKKDAKYAAERRNKYATGPTKYVK